MKPSNILLLGATAAVPCLAQVLNLDAQLGAGAVLDTNIVFGNSTLEFQLQQGSFIVPEISEGSLAGPWAVVIAIGSLIINDAWAIGLGMQAELDLDGTKSYRFFSTSQNSISWFDEDLGAQPGDEIQLSMTRTSETVTTLQIVNSNTDEQVSGTVTDDFDTNDLDIVFMWMVTNSFAVPGNSEYQIAPVPDFGTIEWTGCKAELGPGTLGYGKGTVYSLLTAGPVEQIDYSQNGLITMEVDITSFQAFTVEYITSANVTA